MRVIRRIAVLGAALAVFGTIGVGTALADPPSGTIPALTSIVGVGGDITTQLFSGSPTENVPPALTTDYNDTDPANDLWSWDAGNPQSGLPGGTIVTKGSSSTDETCLINRPYGSSAGLTAMEENTEDDGYYCIDYVRSDRAPESTDPTSIAFVAMAGDATTWSSPESSSATSPVPSTLTLADLVDIYNCTDTNWDQVGGSNAPIVPVLPLSGSGTRAIFLLALGGGTTPLTPGSCVVSGSNSTGDIEPDTGLSAGNVAQFDPDGTPAVDDIFPYSVGDYIAQGPATDGVGGHASSYWGHGVLVLHDMTTNSGTVEAPTTTNSSGQPIINRSFEPQLQNILYNAVRNGGTAADPAFPTTPSYEATGLPAIFGPKGWICTNATAQADIISYGFWNLGGNCGTITDSYGL
jgi:hypothetical protein